ncbi:hypothetical protein [Roseinatronobacter sp. S2]|uniref:hypothetical protein n=1 Tax=Roseinatronobacter sp. S2 TaxID=3035471 RepID=UPI00240EF390|nr:hypothetical protein [Roseinatronobacter sp. S2]WFE76447.1 hypothetical protein P8S53_16680 [Roseinatronobacter sp. S2]
MGADIAGTNWLPAAIEAVRLASVVYIVPFMILLYPRMVGQGGGLAERTIALAQQALLRDPTAGSDTMLVARMRAALPACHAQRGCAL